MGKSSLLAVALFKGRNGFHSSLALFLVLLLVSSKKKKAKLVSRNASAVANQNGTTGENELRKPPIKGPTIKPMPKAAPMSPRLCVLSFGSFEISTRQLWAVEILPAAIPSIMRPMKRNIRLCAEAKTNQPSAVLEMLIIRIGRRPIRSESAPRKGLLMNEQNAKTLKSKVTIKADA